MKSILILLFLMLMGSLFLSCNEPLSSNDISILYLKNAYLSNIEDSDSDEYYSSFKITMDFEIDGEKDIYIIAYEKKSTGNDYTYLYKTKVFTVNSDDNRWNVLFSGNNFIRDIYDFKINIYSAETERFIAQASGDKYPTLSNVGVESENNDVSAQLSVSKTSLKFGQTTTELTFQISNPGGGELHWEISDNRSWLSTSSTSGTTTSEIDEITVYVNGDILRTLGTHNANITITSDTGMEKNISVEAEVGGYINITVTDSLLDDINIYVNNTFYGKCGYLNVYSFEVYVTAPFQFKWQNVPDKYNNKNIGTVFTDSWTISDYQSTMEIEVNHVLTDKIIFCAGTRNKRDENYMLVANWGRSDEYRCPRPIIPDGQTVFYLGYYELHNDTEIRWYPESANFSGEYYTWSGYIAHNWGEPYRAYGYYWWELDNNVMPAANNGIVAKDAYLIDQSFFKIE